MAMGVPVVTSAAAAGGVDAVDRKHFLVASTPRQVADAVLHVLENPAERSRLSQAGRARMLSHHDWERSMQRLDRILERFDDAAHARAAQPTAPVLQP
jgi:glycosyltransferase involved in cell wall biosynthesis